MMLEIKPPEPLSPEKREALYTKHSDAVTYILSDVQTSKTNLKRGHQFCFNYLQSLRQVETSEPSIPLAAVGFEPHSAIGKLYLNPWNTRHLTTLQYAGMLYHEVLHVAFGHVTVYQHLFIEDNRVANIAADLVSNYFTERDGYKLPEGKGLYDGDPDREFRLVRVRTIGKDLGCENPPEGESFEFYYAWLKRKQQEMRDKNPEAREMAEQIIQELYERTNHQDSLMEKLKEMSSDQQEMVKRMVASHLQQALQNSPLGSLPGDMQASIEKVLAVLKPKVKIEHLLSDFLGGCGMAAPYISTARTNRHDLPGIVSFKPGIAAGAVLDSSASQSDGEFGYCVGLLAEVAENQGVAVFAQQSSCGETETIWELDPAELKGRVGRVGYGGTNMRPGVMNFMDETLNRTEHAVGGVIVLSDGELGMDSLVLPEEADVPILWLFTRKVSNPFGSRKFAGTMYYFNPEDGTVERIA